MAASLEEYYGLYLSEKYATTYAGMAKTTAATTTSVNTTAPVSAGISGKMFTYGAVGLGALALILLMRK